MSNKPLVHSRTRDNKNDSSYHNKFLLKNLKELILLLPAFGSQLLPQEEIIYFILFI